MVPVLPNAAARAHFLAHHGLVAAPSGPGRGDDLAGVIRSLGFVQVDSVNTLARAHDLILWSRRQRYRPPALDRLQRDRQVFEHWTHDAAVLPMEVFPHWRLKHARDRAHMDRRWQTWRREGFRERFDDVLRHIADHGPACSQDVGQGEARGSSGWWDWHPSKTALEYLWRSGELAICHRKGFRKHYDLTERVVPPEFLNRRHDPEETIDWACGAALDRLGFATSGEIADFWDLATKAEARDWVAHALEAGRVVEVDVEGWDGRLRRAVCRPDLLDAPVPAASGRVRLLSPFDPALRDRARAERLFGFRYRIEIFVPAPKRQYGYYVFPVMEGTRLVGRLDARADRAAGVLRVTGWWREPGVRASTAREARLVAELDRVCRLAGVEGVVWEDGWRR